MEEVWKEQKVLEPFTDEQKKVYKKIGSEINKCNNTLKASFIVLEKEEK